MLFNPNHGNFRPATAVAADRDYAELAAACAALPRSRGAERVHELIRAGAWIDAALALAAIELPAWTMRRLAYDDGEWMCSLSRQPNLPTDVDHTADGWHALPALAIWNALLEARHRAATPEWTRSAPVPQVRATSSHVVCCDNFA